jgi:outer membrane protein OmpA-like peptidoglycan-associated protein
MERKALMARVILSFLIILLLTGCGANKKYVNTEVANSEARIAAKITELAGKTDMNAQDITKLQNLALELSQKTDKAINEAKGFEEYQVIWEGNVTFPFNSSDLDGVAQQVLNEAADKMNSNKQAIIEISGHTDATGPSAYNYQLGEKRANSAKRYLADKFSVAIYRMFLISYGKDKPISMPDTKNANSKNRRVSLRIWAPVTK